uniref:Uncharacterized protein n=1 Tax=Rhipicephalus appendiculatus TaxID=34631 RepID=A0A131YWX6_RHIAP
MEHNRSLTGGSPSNLSLRCREGKSTPKFDECAVLYAHSNEETRLMVEACHIDNTDSACMSQPSINLYKEEIKCLIPHVDHHTCRTERYRLLPGHAQITFCFYFVFRRCAPFSVVSRRLWWLDFPFVSVFARPASFRMLLRG